MPLGTRNAVGIESVGGIGFTLAGDGRHVFAEIQAVIIALAFIVLRYQLQLTVIVNVDGAGAHDIQTIRVLQAGLRIIEDQRIVIAIIPAAKTLISHR